MTRLLVPVLILTVLMAGCSRKEEPVEEIAPINKLYNDMQAELGADNAAGAVELLENALSNEEFVEYRPGIFNSLLSILLENGQAEDAVTRHLKMAADAPEAAEYSSGMMAQRLEEAAEPALFLSWTTAFRATPLSDTAKAAMYVAHTRALIANDQANDSLALIGECRQDIGPGDCLRVYRDMVQLFIAKGLKETADLALSSIEENAAGDAATMELVTLSRLQMNAADGKWSEFTALITKDISNLSDAGTGSALNFALRSAQPAVVDGLCSLVIESRQPLERCTLTAARKYLSYAAENSLPEVPGRLEKLISKGMPAEKLIHAARQPFYAVLQSEDKVMLGEMISLVKSLSGGLTEERDTVAANGMLLDGSFILNDYDTAIAMVEKGVAGHDENWHKSALVKLKAHRALDAGNTAEAVKYFREFMNVIADTMDREVDPTSGLTYTANWCLARNARRIGDLLKESGDSKAAVDAYKEAKGHFEKALAEFPESSDEYSAISKESQDVPSAI